MVSKEPGKCLLSASDSDVEPAASLALEMKYALDPNRQIKKRNKALQVRFKDICEAQNEQRDKQLAGSATQDPDKKEPKAVSYKAAYRKYMTVPARRSIPNVTRSTGVQTSPDLKKCYQTFPLDRKKGNALKSASTVEGLQGEDNGFVLAAKDRKGSQAGSLRAAELVAHSSERANAWKSSDLHTSPKEPPLPPPPPPSPPPPLPSLADPAVDEPARPPSRGRAAMTPTRLSGEEVAQPLHHGRVFKTEVATVYLPASQPDLPSLGEWSPCAEGDDDDEEEEEEEEEEGGGRMAQLNGDGAARCPAAECNAPAGAPGRECRQIVPHTEVVDLKAQLQVMESLISSSQETIKVLLGVIQELEKGEAHREGLSYRTGQDTANCDTCRNSACIIYSVELDFKQQEDKLQPVLRKLHPIEETQVAPLPYSQESYSSTPKQKSKTESKKHGRWKLWFL
ncbi:F196A protein, partial [Formicarius rufipectus]|nr:F196A protein [Formicarius rufipectus]